MNQDLQKTLWAAADKLRSNMDAAEYKHVVLGLIFLKYIFSDAFDERRDELKAAFADPKHELYTDDESVYAELLEDRDYYTMANVFWVPESKRSKAIRNQAKQPDIGKRIDDALIAIQNTEQSQSLGELRNALLPRLMSGKLRIPEIQEAVEEATT